MPTAGLVWTATAGSRLGAERRSSSPAGDCAPRARSQGAEFPGSCHRWLPGAQSPPLPAESASSLCESSPPAESPRSSRFYHGRPLRMDRSRDAARKAQRAAGGEMGRGGRSARGGAGRDSSGGFEGRCSPAPAPSSPPLQNRRSRGAWTKPGCSGTMTLACFVVALVLGALPEVIGFDLVVTYPLHHRYRHSPPASPRHPHYLPTQQRPQRTPPPPPVPRVPRPPPAMHAQRLHALHAGRTPGPHHRDCPAGEPWVNVTDFGAPCLRWAEVPPFLERSPPASWAQLRGQRHNFCRSPDGAGRPWCFYGHAHGKVDWGYCDCRHGEWSRDRGGSSGLAGSQSGSPRALSVPRGEEV